MSKGDIRLNVYIARSGISSRRKADELIQKGKVTVNGERVTEPFFKVHSTDRVLVHGKSITVQEYVYILFNKPKGVVTTLKDTFASRTIVDCLPSYLFFSISSPIRFFPTHYYKSNS